MPILKNNLPELIREYRVKNPNVTQTDMARLMGIDPATLSLYKNGQINSISIDVWKRLSLFFNAPGSSIFEIDISEDNGNV